MAKLVFGELQAGSGKVLCRVNVTIDGWLTLLDVSLWRDSEGVERLGLPQRNYKGKDGQTYYADTVRLTDGAREGLRSRLWEAYLASPLCQQSAAPEQAQGEDHDPFA